MCRGSKPTVDNLQRGWGKRRAGRPDARVREDVRAVGGLRGGGEEHRPGCDRAAGGEERANIETLTLLRSASPR